MRTHLVALAVAVAAALPIAPAHADPVQDVRDWLANLCEADLCIPPSGNGIECPALGLLSPGVPGVVDISPQGDVVVNGWGVLDCPPYGDLPDPPPDPTGPVVATVWETVWEAYWNGCDVDLCVGAPPWLWPIVDPTLCPPLGTLAPGVPGVVEIGEWGDVSVGGTLVWDCPPYVT